MACRVHFWYFVRSQNTACSHCCHRRQVIITVSHIIMRECRSVSARARRHQLRINPNTYIMTTGWLSSAALVILHGAHFLPAISWCCFVFPWTVGRGSVLRVGGWHRSGRRSSAGLFSRWLNGPPMASCATLQRP